LKILIVKLSSLGDVVHTFPAVQDIRRTLPHAELHWVVERAFAPLVSRCEGISRVIPCDLRRWRKSPFSRQTRTEWAAFKHELQSQAFDAVMDLQGLTKSALIARLAPLTATGKRFAMANRTNGSGYEAPTRWVADVVIPLEPYVHAVQRSRLVCAAALGYTVQEADDYGLAIRYVAEHALSRPTVALIHGTSRADKEWSVAHWVELGRRLNQAGFSIVIAHGNAAEKATSEAIAHQLENTRVWPAMGLDVLVDAMAQCVGVIGVDSGLSHIAVALNLPHVQIYNFDTAWRTGPRVPHQISVFAQPQPSVDAVWQAWGRVKPA
jgi:heptosyltransferase-1